MKVTIEYCAVWNYLPRASSLEAKLKQTFQGIDVQLISSGGGVFEVKVNNHYIFSKKEENRFPEENEIEALIAGIESVT